MLQSMESQKATELNCIDLEIVIVSKESKKKKTDRHHMILHMWNLKYDTNELTY